MSDNSILGVPGGLAASGVAAAALTGCLACELGPVPQQDFP